MSEKFTITSDAGETLKLVFKAPEAVDIEEADRMYAAKVASLIRDDAKKSQKLLLRSELNGFLNKSGVWTKDDETKVNLLQEKVSGLLARLRAGGIALKEGRKLSIEVMDTRREIVGVMQKRQIFDDSTIEAMAETDRNDYFIFACTVYEDSGNKYWETFEDLKAAKLSSAYRRASEAASKVLFGIDIQFEKTLPETKWLKKFNFIDEDLNFIDRKTKERVDRDGQPIIESQKQFTQRVEDIIGDIVEQTPYLDDDTGLPVTTEVKDSNSNGQP